MTLLLPKPVRQRSKAHLAYVGAQPCCAGTCYGGPVQVHHVTYAQPRARGLKVSDAYTVPTCLRHHLEAHAGDERAFWRRFGIDPLAVAEELWADSVQARKVKP